MIDQEANIDSEINNSNQRSSLTLGAAVSANIPNSLSGTTSAVASVSAAPSTIRDMTLPPLSEDQASDNFTRQHDVTINASIQPYGTEGPSNENTLQYDNKNLFNSTANRSVQGCVEDSRSSRQSRNNNNDDSSAGCRDNTREQQL